MTDSELVLAFAKKVQEQGGTAYYVGGIVRDHLLHRENKDCDIEIHGITPEKLEELLSSFGTVRKYGVSFGVFGLEHHDVDIAMPRKETATGRGHKDFDIFVDPFIGEENAARRRDFTINAMMANAVTGEILDFFHGQEDLKAGILRHVNDTSFAEDPLRVLRGAQFAARFRFTIADETREFCRHMDLTALAHERIFGELEKALLKGEKPSLFFEELRKMDQLKDWFPEVERLIGIEQNPEYHPEGDVWVHTMEVLDRAAALRPQAKNPLGFMLSALCHDFGKITATKLENGKIHAIGHETEGIPIVNTFLSRIDNREDLLRYVDNMVALHMRPNMLTNSGARHKKFMKMFDLSVCPEDLLLLAAADAGEHRHGGAGELLQEKLKAYHKLLETPPVRGADLMQEGYKPSKEFSEMIAFAREMWLAGVPREQILCQLRAAYPKDAEKPQN